MECCSNPDVILPGEGLAGSDARERDGFWRRRKVESRRVDAEAFEGVAEWDLIAEREDDGDLTRRVGVVAETEAAEESVEVASESGRSQGRGAA